MNNANSPQSTTSSRSGRKQRKDGEGTTEPGQKPKKVNSDIRKQQNRIASRNYREKRKRKLQYLQQLLKEGPDDQEGQQATDSDYDERTRSVSAEYTAQVPTLHSMPYSNTDFNALSSTTGNVSDPVLATSAIYESQFITTSQPFGNPEPSWTPAMFDVPSQSHLSTWAVPHWMPNLDYSTQMAASGHENFQYTPPHTQQGFDRISTPPQAPQETASNANLFSIGSYRGCSRSTERSRGIPSSMAGQTQFVPKRSVFI